MKKMLLAAAVALMGVHGVASAAWTEITSINAPANGTFNTYKRVKTPQLKVSKVGLGCAGTRMTFSPVGRDAITGAPIQLGLTTVGQTADGSVVYQVNPTATIFNFTVATQAFDPEGCTYHFYAKLLEDGF